MTNADLFQTVFNGLTATELWAKPESEFLEWLNAEAIPNGTFIQEQKTGRGRMEQIIKIRLSTGEERECNYHSEEEMFAETEANGEKVVEWWLCN